MAGAGLINEIVIAYRTVATRTAMSTRRNTPTTAAALYFTARAKRPK